MNIKTKSLARKSLPSSIAFPQTNTKIAFRRAIQDARTNEQEMFNTIFHREIAPFYRGWDIVTAKISAQFLDENETNESGLHLVDLIISIDGIMEIVQHNGDYLGYIYAKSLYKNDIIIDGKYVLSDENNNYYAYDNNSQEYVRI